MWLKERFRKLKQKIKNSLEYCPEIVRTEYAKRVINTFRLPQVPPLNVENINIYDNMLLWPYQGIIDSKTKNSWMTDEEELGLWTMNLGNGETKRFKIPLLFPSQLTGAHGAKREWGMLNWHAGDSAYFTLQNPFSDQRGWGNDNYILAFDLRALKRPVADPWKYYHRIGSSRWKMEAITPDCKTAKDIRGVACNELRLRKSEQGLEVVLDYTPYHLDDWKYSAESIPFSNDTFNPFSQGLEIEEAHLIEADEFKGLVQRNVFGNLKNEQRRRELSQYGADDWFGYMGEKVDERNWSAKKTLYDFPEFRRFLCKCDQVLASKKVLPPVSCAVLKREGRARQMWVMIQTIPTHTLVMLEWSYGAERRETDELGDIILDQLR